MLKEPQMSEAAQNYANARKRFLSEAFPKEMKEMQQDGTLASHLREVGMEADETAQHQTVLAMRPLHLIEDYSEKVAKMNQVPLMVDDLIKNEILFVPPL